MAHFLEGEWRAYRLDKSKGMYVCNEYPVIIKSLSDTSVAIQELSGETCKKNWANFGVAKNVGGVKTMFSICWAEDYNSSNTQSIGIEHNYSILILDNDVTMCVYNSDNSIYSYGNWIRNIDGVSDDEINKKIMTLHKINIEDINNNNVKELKNE